jgi:hypothetical protein
LPFVWDLFHGNGDPTHWWTSQSLREEDARASTFFMMLAGADGFVQWGFWAYPVDGTTYLGQNGPNQPHAISPGSLFYTAARPQTLTSTSGVSRAVRRYDPLYIRAYDSNTHVVTFQVGVRDGWGWGTPPTDSTTAARRMATSAQVDKVGDVPQATFPEFTMNDQAFLEWVRVPSQSLTAAFEAAALTKWIERALYFGVPREDISPKKQWDQPVLTMRVQYGPYHVIGTYNQAFEDAAAPTNYVTLNDFEGVTGRTLKLAADAQTRFYVAYTP